ncbi:MAG: hypothetical protein ACLFVO_21815, partial [Chloroflexaceae bacterium]
MPQRTLHCTPIEPPSYADAQQYRAAYQRKSGEMVRFTHHDIVFSDIFVRFVAFVVYNRPTAAGRAAAGRCIECTLLSSWASWLELGPPQPAVWRQNGALNAPYGLLDSITGKRRSFNPRVGGR